MLPDTPRRYALLLAALLLAASRGSRPQGAAQEAPRAAPGSGEDQAPASHELYESARIQFSAPPPTVVTAGVQCDLNGNIFVIYTASLDDFYALTRNGMSVPVSKVSLDSKNVVQFPVGQFQGYAEYSRPSFYVDPRGNMFGLVTAYRHERDFEGPNWPESLIVKYKDDGTVDSVVKLEPPPGEHTRAWRFAVFLDGNFLVTGTVLSDRYVQTRPFTGIFDRGGAFVGPLTLPHDVRVGPPKPIPLETDSGAPPQAGGGAGASQEPGHREPVRDWILDVQQGLMAGSPDGNVYLLRGTDPARLYTISPAGTVVREFQVKPTEPGIHPIQMSLAGRNGLLLKFDHMRRSKTPQSREPLGLFDLGTGKITDTYNLPPNAGGISACGTVHNEFLFLGNTKDNQLEVVKFAAR